MCVYSKMEAILNRFIQSRPTKPPRPTTKPPRPTTKPPIPTTTTTTQPPAVLNKGIKRSLLIGINYLEDPRNRLAGCINDIINIEKNLRTTHPECTEYRRLSDDQSDPTKKPTRKNILDGIQWLTTGLQAGESIFFHYSGHGGLTVDKSGDETTGFDSCIYPIRNGTVEVITDDELRALLVHVMPVNTKCFAVLDCCHSGSALDLRYVYNAPTYGTLTISQNEKYPKTNGSVVMLSGCKDSQTAADTVDAKNVPSGALTNALLHVWNTYGMEIKFKYLLWDIRKVLQTGGYDQIPQLSCSTNINISDSFKL